MKLGDEAVGLFDPWLKLFDDRLMQDLGYLVVRAGFSPDTAGSIAQVLSETPGRYYKLSAGATAHDIQAAADSPDRTVLVRVCPSDRSGDDATWVTCDDGYEIELFGDLECSAWLLAEPVRFSEEDPPGLMAWRSEETEDDLWLPDYGLSHAENFARSRLLGLLAILMKTPGLDGQVREYFCRSLAHVHEPELDLPSEGREFLEGLRESNLEYLAEFTGPPQLPAPRLVKSAAQAEVYVGEVMESLGLTNVRVTPVGADGGVDVTSDEAVAQVKMEGVSTGRPVLQAISGIASHERKRAMVFSLAGFTQQALEWGGQAELALFEFSLDGSIEPRSPAARALILGLSLPSPVSTDSVEQPDSGEAAPGAESRQGNDLAAQLREIAELHQAGVLSDDEFSAAKARLLR